MHGTQHSRLAALRTVFEHMGCSLVDTRTIEVTFAYPSFDAFWSSQTPSYTPTTKIIEAMAPASRERLMHALHETLPAAEGGKIEFTARRMRSRHGYRRDRHRGRRSESPPHPVNPLLASRNTAFARSISKGRSASVSGSNSERATPKKSPP